MQPYSQQPRGVQRHIHIRKLLLDQLDRNRPPKLFSGFGVFQPRIVSALRHADRQRRDRYPPAIQRCGEFLTHTTLVVTLLTAHRRP